MSTLKDKFEIYRKNRPTDTRSSEERQIARNEITRRLKLYRDKKDLKDEDLRSIIREQNEIIENQAAEIERLEKRLGNPLQTINRDSPLTIVYPEQTMLPNSTVKRGGKYKRINKTRKNKKNKKIKKKLKK